MTRTILSMDVADISVFAKTLRSEISRLDHKPSHVEMLNLLCRAAGFRNYQHFRAQQEPSQRAVQPESMAIAAPREVMPTGQDEPLADEMRVMRTLRVFDREGRIIRWPTKRSQQELCLWLLWSKIPVGRSFSEREIGDVLNALHLFGDAALLRRDLFDLGLVTRKRDGSDYRRVERKPPPELRLLLSKIKGAGAQAA